MLKRIFHERFATNHPLYKSPGSLAATEASDVHPACHPAIRMSGLAGE